MTYLENLLEGLCFCDIIKIILLFLFFVIVLTIVIRAIKIYRIENKMEKIIKFSYDLDNN